MFVEGMDAVLLRILAVLVTGDANIRGRAAIHVAALAPLAVDHDASERKFLGDSTPEVNRDAARALGQPGSF